MKRFIALAGIAAAAMPALAPAEAQRNLAARQQERVRHVVVYGREACPRGREGEIVICARRPADERYRIPRAVRDRTPLPGPASTSWAARTRSIERVGRTGIQSCSPVGPGGYTGCWNEMMEGYRAERAAAERGE